MYDVQDQVMVMLRARKKEYKHEGMQIPALIYWRAKTRVKTVLVREKRI